MNEIAKAGSKVQAIIPTDIEQLSMVAKYCAVLHGYSATDTAQVAKMAAIMQTGMELGLPPMSAVRMIDVIPKRGGGISMRLSAEGQRSVCLASPKCDFFSVRPNYDSEGRITSATARGKRSSGQEETAEAKLSEFKHLIDREKKSNKGGAWQDYTEDMLIARATSRLAKRLFPDLCGGLHGDYDSNVIDVSATVQQADELPALPLAGGEMKVEPKTEPKEVKDCPFDIDSAGDNPQEQF